MDLVQRYLLIILKSVWWAKYVYAQKINLQLATAEFSLQSTGQKGFAYKDKKLS